MIDTLASRIRELAALRGADMSIFDPPVDDARVDDWERQNGAELPADYRRFVTRIASGGPGPSNGLLPFTGSSVDERFALPWIDPIRWNETDGDYDEEEGEEEGGVYQGVLAVADLGCGSLAMLVLVGPHRGEVWYDLTAGDSGYRKVGDSFQAWYGAWVDDERIRLEGAAAASRDALGETLANADAKPTSEDALTRALYQLGPAADERFGDYLRRALDVPLSFTSTPAIVNYALDLSLGELAEEILDGRVDDENTVFRCLRALVRAKLGRLEEAMSDWVTAQADDEFDPPPQVAARIATCFLEAGDIDGAVRVLVGQDDFVCESPSELEIEDSKVAFAFYDAFFERLQAIEIPDDDDDDALLEFVADLHVARIAPLLRLGRVDDAYEQAALAQKNGAWVDNARMALVACDARQFVAALEFLDKAHARPWWMANLRGCALEGLDRFDEALDAFEESLRHRNWLVPYENRAYTLIRLGRFDDAERILSAVESFTPEFAWTYYHRAAMLARQGSPDDAKAALQRAIDLGFDPEMAQTEPFLVPLLNG